MSPRRSRRARSSSGPSRSSRSSSRTPSMPGATDVRVELVDGGKRLIRVRTTAPAWAAEDAAALLPASFDEQDLPRGGPRAHRHARLPRRGPGQHRRGFPADAQDLRTGGGRDAGPSSSGKGRGSSAVTDVAFPTRHERRSPGPVLQPAGPAEVPALRTSPSSGLVAQVPDQRRPGRARRPVHPRPRAAEVLDCPAGGRTAGAGLPALRQEDPSTA